MEILKYETENTQTMAEVGVNSQTITQNQFQASMPDLEAVADTDDFLALNHYGENPPDTTTNDWWDGGSDSSTKYNLRYRQYFELDHISAGSSRQTEYQILQRLDTATLVSAGKMNTDGDDIRFLDSD